MGDQRQSFELEARGTVATGVADQWEAPYPGEITDIVAVIRTAPTGASLIFQVRVDGTVAATGTIPASATEVDVVVSANVAFAKNQTVDLNITQVGSTVAGADLGVTVQHITN